MEKIEGEDWSCTSVPSASMIRAALLAFAVALTAHAAEPPPVAVPPYYSVRYEASESPGELGVAVTHTVWIPPGVETLRGVIVHQHG